MKILWGPEDKVKTQIFWGWLTASIVIVLILCGKYYGATGWVFASVTQWQLVKVMKSVGK